MSTSFGWEGKGRYGSFRFQMIRRSQGVQVKLRYPLTMRAIPECLRDTSCEGAIQIDYLYLFLITSESETKLFKTKTETEAAAHWPQD